MAGLRLAVLDDGLFVRTYAGTIHPVAATFHRFVEAVARSRAFQSVRYVIPVRSLRIWENDPSLPAVDESVLDVVPTASFSGIADYLARSAYMLARNWPIIDRAISESDLVWLRLPASNAPIALLAARRHSVPYFGWVAGSVGDVVRAQKRHPPLAWVARAIGAGYDEVTHLAARGGPVMSLDGKLFNSVITGEQVAASRLRELAVDGPPWRIAWAGRMAGEKGLPVLFEAVRMLLDGGLDMELLMIGDGPERQRVESLAADLPVGRVRLCGYVGDPEAYLDLLRSAHVLAHPSGAEAVPKVVGEAMAAGLPIVASDVGAVREILGAGERGRLIPPGDPHALAESIRGLLTDPDERRTLRERGLDWAADHTAERQADRMIDWARQEFPRLPW
ncbi:MAG: glycosyltransferase family 4 protein [Chloroflexota bacterium]